ncbi:MAG: hypothetical protein ACK4QP_23515, partial [Pseudorhizobium sp.]
PLYIVYPRTRHLGNKVRVFVDWLVKLLKESSARDAQCPRRLAVANPKADAEPLQIPVAAE